MFDDGISYMLNAALWSYEMEKLAGSPLRNEEFEDMIKRAVPEGIFSFHINPCVLSKCCQDTHSWVFHSSSLILLQRE